MLPVACDITQPDFFEVFAPQFTLQRQRAGTPAIPMDELSLRAMVCGGERQSNGRFFCARHAMRWMKAPITTRRPNHQ